MCEGQAVALTFTLTWVGVGRKPYVGSNRLRVRDKGIKH